MNIRKTRSGRFEARKMAFLKTPSGNLYSRNLDNDACVVHNLLDSDEEAETKEAVLGWYFLRAAGQPSTLSALDEHIEGWFRESLGRKVDLEVDDGVEKLLRLGLVTSDDGRLTALPAREALRQRDARWDETFCFDRR